MQAFILAAGLGTRLRPVTGKIPKALIEVNGTPMLELVIKHLKSSGFKDLIINIHHLGEQILEFLDEKKYFGVSLQISDERELLLGTGGAIKKARPLINDDEPLLIHNVDVISSLDLGILYNFHKQQGNEVTLAVQKRESSNYLLFDAQRMLVGWKSVTTGASRISKAIGYDPEMLAFSGVHVVGPGFLEFAENNGCFPHDKNVFSIIDVYLCLAKNSCVKAYDHSGSFWIDLGKPESLEKASRLFATGKLKY